MVIWVMEEVCTRDRVLSSEKSGDFETVTGVAHRKSTVSGNFLWDRPIGMLNGLEKWVGRTYVCCCSRTVTTVIWLSISRGSRSSYSIRQGRRLRGDRKGSSPQIFRWRGWRCFYPPPQCLENVIANCHGERNWEEEKQKIRHQWQTHKLIL